jgi:glutathione S-transferase
MKLYFSRGTCAFAAHIALFETGLPFSAERVDLKAKKTAGGRDFHEINPNGYVPVLELDDGTRLTEAGVVLQYIADRAQGPLRAPDAGTLERYRLMQWLTFISSELHKAYSTLFSAQAPEEYKNAVRERVALRLAHVDAQLAGRDYLLGMQISVADLYLYVVLNWSRAVGVDLTRFANLVAFRERIAARPAVQRAAQAEASA